MTDADDTLAEVASAPKKASGDMGSVENHSLLDLMKYADKAAAGSPAFDSDGRPRLRISKMIPPGAI